MSSSLLSPTIKPPYFYNNLCKYDYCHYYCHDIKVIVTMIVWKDYPKPNLRFIRNVWVVEVSIPTPIRNLFGNVSWATNNKRKATCTIDKTIAERWVTELAHRIYKEFDEAKLEYANFKSYCLITFDYRSIHSI